MLAPDVVMTISLLLPVAEEVIDSRGTLLESMTGVTPFAKKPEEYLMVIVPPDDSVVVAVKSNVRLTPALFKLRW
jgi:hypothetical protein